MLLVVIIVFGPRRNFQSLQRLFFYYFFFFFPCYHYSIFQGFVNAEPIIARFRTDICDDIRHRYTVSDFYVHAFLINYQLANFFMQYALH